MQDYATRADYISHLQRLASYVIAMLLDSMPPTDLTDRDVFSGFSTSN